MRCHFGFRFDSFVGESDDNSAMPSTLETSPATDNRKEMIDAALEQTREQAMEEAAKQELKVSEVKNVQLEKLDNLFGAKGSDGAATMGEDLSIQEEMKAEVEKDHAERMKNIEAAPDAYVLPDEGTTVGLQHDDTREIGIAGRALDSDRVARHEAKHREQEAGDQSVELPPTGDPEIDEVRTLSRRAFREKGAIDAEGGLKDHTPEYFEYVKSSNRIAQYLKRNGMDGDAMVDEAGDTNAGFDKLHESIMIASLKKRIAEGAPAFSNN
jgi:hypothetical protein